MKHHRILSAAALTYALVISNAAMAETVTANLNVSLRVIADCSIQTATLAFTDQVVGFASNVDNGGSVTVKCSPAHPYSVAFNSGQNANGSQRRMTDGNSNYINYQIYKDAARTTVLGDGSGGTDTIASSGAGSNQTLTVYARATGTPMAPIGNYADQVLMTMTY